MESWNFIAGRFYDNDETGGSRQYSLLILLRKLGNQADDCRKNWSLGVGLYSSKQLDHRTSIVEIP